MAVREIVETPERRDERLAWEAHRPDINALNPVAVQRETLRVLQQILVELQKQNAPKKPKVETR